jgi:hypothetical protein
MVHCDSGVIWMREFAEPAPLRLAGDCATHKNGSIGIMAGIPKHVGKNAGAQ